MQEKTFSGYLTRSVIQFAAYQGVNIDELCTTVGLDPEMLKMPDQRIPRTLHYAVWREVVKQTGDENLGLHVGEMFSLGNFGIAGYVLLNCQTLKDVFEKFCRYTCLFCQGVLSSLSISDGVAFLECNSVPESVPTPELLENARYDIEDTFVSALTAIQSLTGKALSPAAVWFCHRAPSDLGEHKRIFQAELKFSMPSNRLIFDANCLDWPILSSNANLLPLFEQHADLMLEEMNRTKQYTRRVVQAIAQQISKELPTIQAIARELAISVRQLQRELNTEGTTFQKLLDETRKELALRHLHNPATPIHDIAFLLGFSEPSAFNRAFKRWTGTTPSSYRLLG